jgi:hypothetical protein
VGDASALKDEHAAAPAIQHAQVSALATTKTLRMVQRPS